MPRVRAKSINRGGILSRRGFTLVELIVVMLLIAIVGVTALTAMGSTPQTKQRVAVRMLARDLAFARERAMALGTPAWVRVNLSADSVDYLAGATWASAIALTETGSGRPLRTRLDGTSDGMALDNVELGTVNGSFTPDPYILGFDWRGQPTNSAGAALASDVSITVTVPAFPTATVVVRAVTGTVTYTLP
jgi:prepilin-type N-terminal cleavage/methylation domain-containing protein